MPPPEPPGPHIWALWPRAHLRPEVGGAACSPEARVHLERLLSFLHQDARGSESSEHQQSDQKFKKKGYPQ